MVPPLCSTSCWSWTPSDAGPWRYMETCCMPRHASGGRLRPAATAACAHSRSVRLLAGRADRGRVWRAAGGPAAAVHIAQGAAGALAFDVRRRLAAGNGSGWMPATATMALHGCWSVEQLGSAAAGQTHFPATPRRCCARAWKRTPRAGRRGAAPAWPSTLCLRAGCWPSSKCGCLHAEGGGWVQGSMDIARAVAVMRVCPAKRSPTAPTAAARSCVPGPLSAEAALIYLQSALLVVRTLLTDHISQLEGRAGRWIVQRDFPRLARVLAAFVGVSVPAALVTSGALGGWSGSRLGSRLGSSGRGLPPAAAQCTRRRLPGEDLYARCCPLIRRTCAHARNPVVSPHPLTHPCERAGLKYLQKRIKLSFQRRLSLKLHGLYTSHRAYYAASTLGGLSHADQRITEDVERFSHSISELYRWGVGGGGWSVPLLLGSAAAAAAAAGCPWQVEAASRGAGTPTPPCLLARPAPATRSSRCWTWRSSRARCRGPWATAASLRSTVRASVGWRRVDRRSRRGGAVQRARSVPSVLTSSLSLPSRHPTTLLQATTLPAPRCCAGPARR